jgi:hypothetical protein
LNEAWHKWRLQIRNDMHISPFRDMRFVTFNHLNAVARGGNPTANLRPACRLPRPNVEGYKPPERWLRNLFEDGLKETLETSQLPVNVSKINDCMKRLDPTYHITESGVQ